MGQAFSSNNPLDYKFDIPRPKFNPEDIQQLKTHELESIKNLRIYTNMPFDDQNFQFDRIDCQHFKEIEESQGNYYYGQYVNHQKQGLGIQVFENVKSGIEMAFGNFVDNQLDGQGLVIYKDNTYYHGSWRRGTCQGFGYYTTNFGDFYLGNWEDGEFIYGIYRTSDFEYQGYLKNGRFEGLGRCYYFDGSIVQGTWKDDQLDGFANHYFTNTDNYIGFYKKSLKHGKGILYENSEKKIYQGEFFLDQFHGVGREIDSGDNKKFISAIFRQGKPYLLYNEQIYSGHNSGDLVWKMTESDENNKEGKKLEIKSEYNFEDQNQNEEGEIYQRNEDLSQQIDKILNECEGFKQQYEKLEKRLKQLPILHQLQKWHYEQNQDQFPQHFRNQYQKFLKEQYQQQQQQ